MKIMNNLNEQPLILGSSSIYRKDLLKRLGLPFIVRKPNIDETPKPQETPLALACRLSKEKALSIAQNHPNAIVIGCDQVATLHNEPIGKPHTFDNAVAQLTRFSDQCVIFHSALTVCQGNRYETISVPTYCHFRTLTDAEIRHYLEQDQPFNTAGSAKAESLGISLMQKMTSDDPTAIIGLPLIELSRLLRQFGLNPTQHGHIL